MLLNETFSEVGRLITKIAFTMQINIVPLTIMATSAAVPGSTLQVDSIVEDEL